MRNARKLVIGGGALALVLAFTAFRPPSTGGPIERDFEAYYAAGATANAGGDPYSRAVWSAEREVPGVDAGRDELLPFVGPAAALPLWSLLARLPYGIAVLVWTAILIGSILAVVAAALRLARAPVQAGRIALVLGVTLASAPVIGSLALGQAALVAAAGVAGAVVTYGGRRPVGAWLTTLVAAVQPNLALVLAARLRSRWDLAVASAAAAAFGLLTLAAGSGPAGFLGYLRRLSAHGAAERASAIQHTPAAIAHAFGWDAGAAAALAVAVALAALAGGVAIVRLGRLGPADAVLTASALLPLAIPFFHEHDFVIEVLGILVLALRARGAAQHLVGVAAVLVLVDWFGLAQRHGAAGQIVCLGAAVAAGLGALGPDARGRGVNLTALAALATLAAFAVPVGLAHPAPTWPDHLPARYRAGPAADVSAIWADEQRVSGLFAREPAWGALRSLPLAGCLVLAAAIVVDARRRRRGGVQMSTPSISSNGVVPLGCQPVKSRL